MKSFRTELEDPIVEQDILDLEKKIHQFHNQEIDEEKFRSLRLARGVYGQRQSGVQMIRIKLPMGRFTAAQLNRIADVSDKYGSGNLHITTRQDIQLHYVELVRTPELWARLEKEHITMREACGNTVRNVTASAYAGIDPEEPFDVTPYAEAFFQHFLRNPVCQEMGRKIKVAFSSSEKDDALVFIHDLGFIPKIKANQRGFQMQIGGGLGSQPMASQLVYSFLPSDELIPFSEAVIRVFDRWVERNRRNKARLKFLIKDLGLDAFLELVEKDRKLLINSRLTISLKERKLVRATYSGKDVLLKDQAAFAQWKKTNVKKQKQENYVSVGLPIQTGDLSSKKARLLAKIVTQFTRNDNRFTIGQSILLRDVKEAHLPALYQAIQALNLDRVGFHKLNDIIACPGTNTCNLGIASSMGLANELQSIIENEFSTLIERYHIKIHISGCMNACGQHNLAQIGFQGMTLKADGLIAPATQLLLGGAVLGNGKGRFADKLLKVPAKKVPSVLRWILVDYDQHKLEEEDFHEYYDRKSKDYFYQALKHFSKTENLGPADFIDWGNTTKYEKAIGIGECAGVTIDLVQTLLFDAEESYGWALDAMEEKRYSDGIYHAYNARIKAAKALLTTKEVNTNSQSNIINQFDAVFPEYEASQKRSFKNGIDQFLAQPPAPVFTRDFIEKTQTVLAWIKWRRNED